MLRLQNALPDARERLSNLGYARAWAFGTRPNALCNALGFCRFNRRLRYWGGEVLARDLSAWSIVSPSPSYAGIQIEMLEHRSLKSKFAPLTSTPTLSRSFTII